MSEQKSKYVPGTVYTQQFACTLPEGWGDVSEETITPIPSSLPTLLARMVNEYAWELDPLTFSQETVEQFSTILLSAAQPLLAKYFDQLANPPMVMKQMTKEEIQQAWNDVPSEKWNLKLEKEYQEHVLNGHDVSYSHWLANR